MTSSREVQSVYIILKELFESAKRKDEFEYCCALLRVRGMEGAGWDTLHESHTLLVQTLSFASSPVDSGFKIRLLLLAYCHAIEMNFIYDMIANMTLISQGESYSMDCFDPDSRKPRGEQVSPAVKIQKIQNWIKDTEYKEIGEILSEMYLKDIRNAFDHSDYVLFKDVFRIKYGDRYSSDLTRRSKEYKLDFLLPKLELGINLALILVQLTIDGIRSYKANKRILSRMMEGDQFFDLELVVDPDRGLTGFQSVLKQKHPQPQP